jgi:hypothetical protein
MRGNRDTELSLVFSDNEKVKRWRQTEEGRGAGKMWSKKEDMPFRTRCKNKICL